MIRFSMHLLTLCALFPWNNPAQGQTNSFPTEEKNFGSNPGNLDMFYYVPEKLKNSSAEFPLVIALHGCSQSLKDFVLSTGWMPLAQKYNFAVVFPVQKLVNNSSRCFNWFMENDLQAVGGECESIKSMYDYMTKNHKIDQNRVFLYGLSAGASMAVNFVINFPTKIRSVASYAGGPYGMANNPIMALQAMLSPPNLSSGTWGSKIKNYDLSTPYPNLVVVHGEEDKTVDFSVSQQLVKQWSYLHKVNADSLKLVSGFTTPDVQKYQLLRDGKSPVVTLFKLLKLGHRIAIHPGEGEDQGGQQTKWTAFTKFFSTYYICKEFGLIESEK